LAITVLEGNIIFPTPSPAAEAGELCIVDGINNARIERKVVRRTMLEGTMLYVSLWVKDRNLPAVNICSPGTGRASNEMGEVGSTETKVSCDPGCLF
jgi:hypothetical protein